MTLTELLAVLGPLLTMIAGGYVWLQKRYDEKAAASELKESKALKEVRDMLNERINSLQADLMHERTERNLLSRYVVLLQVTMAKEGLEVPEKPKSHVQA